MTIWSSGKTPCFRCSSLLPALAPGAAERDVLRVGGERLHAREELLRGGVVVEAEPDAAEVVRREVHHVEQPVLQIDPKSLL